MPCFTYSYCESSGRRPRSKPCDASGTRAIPVSTPCPLSLREASLLISGTIKESARPWTKKVGGNIWEKAFTGSTRSKSSSWTILDRCVPSFKALNSHAFRGLDRSGGGRPFLGLSSSTTGLAVDSSEVAVDVRTGSSKIWFRNVSPSVGNWANAGSGDDQKLLRNNFAP